jgi:iron(III) transport system ATP-binding protein
MEYTVTTPLGELFVVDPHVDRPLPPGTQVSVLPGARGLTLVRE